ncbi:unnamed protein product [Brachionus calyciflorus]|uniref:Reverse transcriptase domain-containing protein n=1 Tax=Brachionus calyciflorus TaxID=104777 RepID=A0A813T616_9BILA|nr:unnamed protein product [Brachionus calyciflorus]
MPISSSTNSNFDNVSAQSNKKKPCSSTSSSFSFNSKNINVYSSQTIDFGQDFSKSQSFQPIILDDSYSNSFYKNDYYYKIRLDRSRHGGGLIVFIRNSLTLTKSYFPENMELISFQIRLNKQLYNFVHPYRAPNLNESVFFDQLEDFIVGDLNSDYNNKKHLIKQFVEHNDLVKFVSKPTKISTKYNKKSNTTKRSSTLIDILLRNGDLVDSTDTIDCPFSDHHFLIAKLNFKKAPNESKKIESQNRKINLKNYNQFHWYDDDLLRLKHQKNSAFKRFVRTQSNDDKRIYEYFNNSFNKYNDEKLIEYFRDKSMSDFKKSKKFWQFYSTKINIKSDKSNSNPISQIKVNGKLHDDKNEVCNIFNGFFTSITPTSMKAGIPTKIFQNSSKKLKNFSILTSSIPNEWKTAVVTPLFKKKGSNEDLNNYRGISILPPVAKLFENLIHKQILQHLNKNNIISDDQHGFRANHSCESALNEIVSEINKLRSKRLIGLLLFIEFKKAFDTVDSQLLLLKLKKYGFSTTAINLLKSYFKNRVQLVKIDEFISNPNLIKLGVPQGSVLGPFLFLISINDIVNYLNNLTVKLFADDTTILLTENNIEKLIEYINFIR